MKNRFFALLAALALLLSSPHGTAAPDAPAIAVAPVESPAAVDLRELVAKINDGIKANKTNEVQQADNLKQFDVLLAKYKEKGDTSDDVARILYMKAKIYLDVFENKDKGMEILKQLQHDFPNSAYAKAADNTGVAADLNALIQKVNADLATGKTNEVLQADNLKQFDVLLDKYKGDSSDDVARILYMKARLYFQVFQSYGEATTVLKQLEHDFPSTAYGKAAVDMISDMSQLMSMQKIQSALAVNAAFPDFNEKDLDGKELSISSYKGKVVMVDFWATWCGPCREEVPNVVKAYEKYHDKGFEIIGISLDHAEDRAKMLDYMKENKMVWRQYFDGQYWTNKLAVKYGIDSIPAGFLLDRDGKIIARGDSIRGPGLEPAIAKALGAN